MISLKINPSEVRGFNYHPSYSYGSLEDWLLFDEKVWKKELSIGKEKFPKMNTVRIWLSWNAYCRLENKFIEHIKTVINICKELNLYVIPCLFNRWHDPMVNCDSIYIDHFLPNSSWLHKFGNLFEDYLDALCNEFKNEEQILVWDICNEPFAYNGNFDLKEKVQQYEVLWLRKMADHIRSNKVTQPLGIGTTGREPMEIVDDICDVYLTHLYYRGENIDSFDKKVARFVEESIKNSKPLIISECCWGSLDNMHRAKLVHDSLSIFKKYNLGFVAHALWYCGCADLHDPIDGRVTPNIGNLCFINKDGNIRPFHEVYNNF